MPRPKKTTKIEKQAKAALPAEKQEKKFVEPLVPDALPSNRRSVASIIGFKFSRYKTESIEKYNEQLRDMNKIDLQRECARVELHPTDNREIMIERLLKQFRLYTAANQTPPQAQIIKIGQKARNILARSATPLI